MINKKAQVTIFIIIGLIILSSVGTYFIFRNNFDSKNIPANIEPIYNTFLGCIEEKIYTGIDVAASQGGYIYSPEFESGSSYSPFGSQLNFLGNSVPYWYYVSGNNIQKEQIPSEKEIEAQIAQYIENNARKCVFDNYYEQGFEIAQGEPEAKVNIKNNKVEVEIDMPFSVSKEEDTALINKHNIVVKSYLGQLYDSALEVYEKENNEMFLEKYSLDVLRLYAPVDGVELTCSPLVWNAEDIFEELSNGLVANINSLRNKNSEINLKNKENNYFLVELGVNEEVNFLTSKNWPYSFEVNPSKGAAMISKPMGNEAGIGMLGFCYVPYHYVYDIKYPVMIQLRKGEELFQFPFAVVIEGNNPRKSLNAQAINRETSEICEYKNTPIKVNVYDSELTPINALISYKCFDEICEIGKTQNSSLISNFPQCINGNIIANAPGFREEKNIYSVTQEEEVDIVLDKLYELEVVLNKDNIKVNDKAIITFNSDNFANSLIYPKQTKINLSEGQYEIEVQIYENSSLRLESSKQEYCTEIPKSGIGGLFELTEEKCFNIEMPEQIISNALSGGGSENYYILESELRDSNIIEINSKGLPKPSSLEQLQNNYIIFENKELEIEFK